MKVTARVRKPKQAKLEVHGLCSACTQGACVKQKLALCCLCYPKPRGCRGTPQKAELLPITEGACAPVAIL
eukprot:1152301-Pelagomonas_calceolata.AAC.5